MKDNICESYYQTGGSLPAGFPTYVSRKADNELFNYLLDGMFCYVLTARQMGKSSLRVSVIERLRKIKDIKCISLDATSIGNENTTAGQWYYSMLYQIARSTGTHSKLRTWWSDNQNLTPVSRFGEFLKKEVLKTIDNQLIIFIDEIDSLLNLDKEKFSTDDFFALIRSFYNERADSNELNKLTFALIGVASPNDLMKDSARTPFNIGKEVVLENFTIEESKPLLNGLKKFTGDKEELLLEIHKWTDGQPYLTQKLCNSLAKEGNFNNNLEEVIKKHVNNIFLSLDVQNESNLSNVNNRILKNSAHNIEMLTMYQQIVAGVPVKSNLSDYAQIYLKLSGLVKVKEGHLVIDNLIYKKYFNDTWLSNAFNEIERPFSEALSRWLKLDKSKDATLRGKSLEEASAWAAGRNDITLLEFEFLNFSRKIEKQSARRKEILIISTISTFLLISVIFAIYAYNLANKEQYARKEAEHQRAIADSVNFLLQSLNENLNNSVDSLTFSMVMREQMLDSLSYESIVGNYELDKIANENEDAKNALSNLRNLNDQQKKQINEQSALVSALLIQSEIQRDSINLLLRVTKNIQDSLLTMQRQYKQVDITNNELREKLGTNYESVSQQIENIAKKIDKFYLTMLETTKDEGSDREYSKFVDSYINIEVDLNSLLSDKKIHPSNKESTRNCEIVLETWIKYKDKHKQYNTISDIDIELNRSFFNDLFLILQTSEEMK